MSKANSTRTNLKADSTYQPKRGVIVMAPDEPGQRDIYERLKAAGFGPLRVVTA